MGLLWYMIGLWISYLFVNESRDYWNHNQKLVSIVFLILAVGMSLRCGYKFGEIIGELVK